ncbi:MAG: hypothetical protein OHK0044_29970 [Burkholderiaceae bacterium]
MNAPDDPAFDTPVPLLRHVPPREGSPIDRVVPAAVTRPEQLPPYLMLGVRDDESFRADADGWSIQWRGMEPQTALAWRYQRSTDTNTFSQRWRGIDGGMAMYPARVPWQRVLGSLYCPFPQDWDAAAHSLHTSNFWLVYVGEPQAARSIVGVPDGPLRSIVVPLCADRIERFAQQWAQRVSRANPPFPLSTHLARVRCDAAYVHGYHGIRSDDASGAAARCQRQTGRRSDVPPERVRVLGDLPAWQVERHLPCAVVTVPFTGLTPALLMLDDVGVMTSAREPFALRDDRPDGAAPLVLPTALGSGVQLTTWPRDHSMRVRWVLPDLLPPLPGPGSARERLH